MTALVEASDAIATLTSVVNDLSTAELAAGATASTALVSKLIKAAQYFHSMWNGGVNQILADAEHRKMLDEMLVEIHSQVYGLNSADVREAHKPTIEDAALYLVELGHESRKASNHKKRWILFQAFFGRFDPKLHEKSMDRIFWERAAQLEYPEVAFLRMLAVYRPDGYRKINVGDERYAFIEKLMSLGLVATKSVSMRGPIPLVITTFGEKFREFIYRVGPEHNPSDPPSRA